MRLHKSERGFTIMELMVAIGIVAVLVAIAIPAYLKQREKGDLLDIQSALTNARTSLVDAQLRNRGVLPAPGPGNTLPADINVPERITIKYKATGTKLCLEATKDNKENLKRYLDTVSASPSAVDCGALVN